MSKSWKQIAGHIFETTNKFGQLKIGVADSSAYRVSLHKVTKVNWLWQKKMCKPDLVWRWLWNSEIRYFLASQPVFMKCLLSALYWTKCKSPQVFFGFFKFLPKVCPVLLLSLSLYESMITENDCLLDDANVFFVFQVLLNFFIHSGK